VKGPWKEHTEHAFVAGLGDGSLPVESFKYYLVQDYLFLVGLFSKDLGSGADSSGSICKSKRSGGIQGEVNE
jgi:thiaminase